MKTEQKKLDYFNYVFDTNYTTFDDVDWYHYSKYHQLSETFIREFVDEVDWNKISEFAESVASVIKERLV